MSKNEGNQWIKKAKQSEKHIQLSNTDAAGLTLASHGDLMFRHKLALKNAFYETPGWKSAGKTQVPSVHDAQTFAFFF